jgi:hypothetical protein
MRRSLGLFVVSAAVAAVASGITSASAASHSQLIVCPLEPTAHIVSCCPLPTVQPVPCCAGSNLACVAGVSIMSSSNPSVARHQVTVSGRLATAAAGATVDLWQALPGGGFQQVAQTSTGSSGTYQFVRTDVNTNRQWYVTAAGATSLTISQSVKAVVTLTRSFVVHVTPNHSGGRVLLEKRTKHGWKVIARPMLGGGSKAQLSVAVHHGQSVTLRAVWPGDKRNAKSFSKAIRLTG